MRILGIDPGYDRLGLALIEQTPQGKQLLYSTCVTSDPSRSFLERLHAVGTAVENAIVEYQPTEAAIEKTFFSKNQKTAIAVSEARGAVLYIISNHRIPVYEYGPQEVKVAVTGYGKSDKKQISAMVHKLIHLPHQVAYDDEYDAIAIALTHGAYCRTSSTH